MTLEKKIELTNNYLTNMNYNWYSIIVLLNKGILIIILLIYYSSDM